MSTLAEHVQSLIAQRERIQPGENPFLLWDDRQFKTDALLLCTTHLGELAALASQQPSPKAPESKQALSEDTKRLDWLESKAVNVRAPLRYGSLNLFWAGPSDDDGLPVKSDLRSRIDSAILADAGGSEK